jgi:hypothetical protein
MGRDIIDNRTRELAPEINNFLADSIRARFAVGYFFLSGFEAIAARLPDGVRSGHQAGWSCNSCVWSVTTIWRKRTALPPTGPRKQC